LVHVFDVDQNYEVVETLDDHSSSITSVRWVSSFSIEGMPLTKLITCSADKSVVFRAVEKKKTNNHSEVVQRSSTFIL
jgi:WD40 repeat protein